MSNKRTARINKTADFNAGTSGHTRNYGFVFSDDISKWMHTDLEKKRENSFRHSQLKRQKK
jgi:hypothetical protein